MFIVKSCNDITFNYLKRRELHLICILLNITTSSWWVKHKVSGTVSPPPQEGPILLEILPFSFLFLLILRLQKIFFPFALTALWRREHNADLWFSLVSERTTFCLFKCAVCLTSVDLYQVIVVIFSTHMEFQYTRTYLEKKTQNSEWTTTIDISVTPECHKQDELARLQTSTCHHALTNFMHLGHKWWLMIHNNAIASLW